MSIPSFLINKFNHSHLTYEGMGIALLQDLIHRELFLYSNCLDTGIALTQGISLIQEIIVQSIVLNGELLCR